MYSKSGLFVWRILFASCVLVVAVAGFSATTSKNKITASTASRSATAATLKQQDTGRRQRSTGITKPFRTRKQISEFRRRKLLPGDPTFRVSAHIRVDEFDTRALFPAVLDTLPPDWQGDDFYDGVRLWRQDDIAEEVNNNGDSKMNGDGGDGILVAEDSPQVFVFRFGAVVFWNFISPEEEKLWMDQHLLSKDFAGVRYKEDAAENAADEITYTYYDSITNAPQQQQAEIPLRSPNVPFKGNVVQLSTRENGEKLAISFALAKSALLSIYEWRLQRTIERNAHIPEELALKGKIDMSRSEIQKEVGRILLVKHGINLDSSLIDTPEEFWEDGRFEGIYESGIRYFDISKRLSLVNNRLDTVKDLTDVLGDAAENRHSEFLEWIIIILIVVEVVLDLLGLGIELRH